MNRREFLAMSCSTLGTSLSGCTSLVAPRKTEIESISLMNLSEKPHRVTIQVTRNGTQVYSHSFQVPQKSEFGTESNPAPVVQEPWMKNPAEFTVSARLSDDGKCYQKQFPVDNKSGCYGVEVRIHAGGLITFPNDSYSEGCS